MSAGVHFSAQKQVKTKKKKGHVRRCPFFGPKASKDPHPPKKQAVVSTETFQNFSWKNDMISLFIMPKRRTCPLNSKRGTYGNPTCTGR